MKINREGSKNNKIYYGQVQGITNAVKLVKVIGTLSLKFTIWRLQMEVFLNAYKQGIRSKQKGDCCFLIQRFQAQTRSKLN